MAKNRLFTQRWQLELLLDGKFLRADFKANGADRATPDFIVSILAVHLEKLLMLVEISELLLDIDRCRLLVDVECELLVGVIYFFLVRSHLN